jgi:hypothetical protein
LPTETRDGPADKQWRSRPGLSRAIRLTAAMLPPVAALGISVLVDHALPRPVGWVHTVLWWVVSSTAALAAMVLAVRLAKRLLPLASLLDLAMVFPDHAPGRFAVARASWRVRDVQRRLDEARDRGRVDGDLSHAQEMLTLVAALSVHDRQTRGHSERVRVFTDMIADELQLTVDDRARLRWASLLHDVGKVHVPAEILNKPGRPTPEEWKVLHRHPIDGARMIAPLAFWLGPWAQAVEQHHERWDGRGYPHGLKGTEISLGGRIVAVADAFETMTAARPYKRGMNVRQAREELVRCSGNQFDPTIVRAFLSLSLGRLRRVVGLGAFAAQVPMVSTLVEGLSGVGARAASSAATAVTALGLVSGGAGMLVPHTPNASPSPSGSATADSAAGQDLVVGSASSPRPGVGSLGATSPGGGATTKPPSGGTGNGGGPTGGSQGGCPNGGATYQGVTCSDIVTAFHWWGGNYPDCPTDQNLATLVPAGTFGSKLYGAPEVSLNLLVDYFNTHANQLYPQAQGKLGPVGFYGRQIQPVYEKDDGGPFCPDVNTATAQRIAQTDRAFAAIGLSTNEDAAQVMQPALAGYHVPSVEATQNRNSWYSQRAPYAWSAVASGDTDVQHLAGVICNLYVGQPASQTGDVTVSGKPRVFSVVNLDDPELNALGDELIGDISRCGATMAQQPADHIEYKKEVSSAGQQTSTNEAELRAGGVTTVVCLCDVVAVEVGAKAFASTGYYPESLVSDFGFLDSPVAASAFDSGLWKYAVATAESNAYDHANTHWCQTAAGQIWCAAYGSKQPPVDFEGWYNALLLYGDQLVAAGPTLTPQNIASGLFRQCGSSYCSEGGFSRPYDPRVGFGPAFPDGEYTTAKDYELVRWDPTAANPYLTDVDPGAQGAYVPYLPSSIGWTRLRDWGLRS